MTLTIELTQEQEQRLKDRAQHRGVSVEVFALAVLERSLRDRREAIDDIIDQVVRENHELYKRLA